MILVFGNTALFPKFPLDLPKCLKYFQKGVKEEMQRNRKQLFFVSIFNLQYYISFNI